MNITRWPDLLRMDPLDEGLRTLMRPINLDLDRTAPQMRLDVREQDNQYTVTAELPGVRKEDIDVRIDGRLVNLSAEVKREESAAPAAANGDGMRTLRSERSYGFVSRSFSLADEIDESKAQARYEDGLLQLTLPKRASSETRRVTVA